MTRVTFRGGMPALARGRHKGLLRVLSRSLVESPIEWLNGWRVSLGGEEIIVLRI